jgi:hypothetical protein
MKELINQFDAEGREHRTWELYWYNGTLGRREHWHHGVRKGLDIQWDSQGRCTQKAYHLVIR